LGSSGVLIIPLNWRGCIVRLLGDQWAYSCETKQ
jgi:hypothetical protein